MYYSFLELATIPETRPFFEVNVLSIQEVSGFSTIIFSTLQDHSILAWWRIQLRGNIFFLEYHDQELTQWVPKNNDVSTETLDQFFDSRCDIEGDTAFIYAFVETREEAIPRHYWFSSPHPPRQIFH